MVVRRIESRVEETGQLTGNASMRGQGVFDVLLAKREAGLTQIFCICAQHDDLIRIEPRRQGEAIEAIAFNLFRPDACKRALKFAFDFIQAKRRVCWRERKIVNVNRFIILARNHIGALAFDTYAHVFQHRQAARKWNRLAQLIQTKAQCTGFFARCVGGPI